MSNKLFPPAFSRRSLYCVAMATVVGAGSLSAASVTFSDTLNVDESNPNVISFSKFNPALGTLTGVRLTVTLSMPSVVVEVDNDSTTAANVTAKFGTLGGVGFNTTELTNSAAFEAITTDDFVIPTQNQTFNLAPTTGDSTNVFDNTGLGDYAAFTTTVINQGEVDHDVSPALISNYIAGSGTGSPTQLDLTLSVDFAANVDVNSGGGAGLTRLNAVLPTATYFASVTYFYDVSAIPEPSATLVLGGVGLFGLMGYRRRR